MKPLPAIPVINHTDKPKQTRNLVLRRKSVKGSLRPAVRKVEQK